MLLPNKHLPLSSSILGVGAFVLDYLARADQPCDLDTLLAAFACSEYKKGQALGALTTEVVLALSFLFAVGSVDVDDAGRVMRCV